MYANCLLFALLYRLCNRNTRIRVMWGTWWCAPHFYVEEGEHVVDFQSHPWRNCTPLFFKGRKRVRSKAAFDRLPDAPSPWEELRYHFKAWRRYRRLLQQLDRNIHYRVCMNHWRYAGNLCARRLRVKHLFNA